MQGVSNQAARPAHSAAGFTLIEVLITLVILATGIVTVLQAFQTSADALGRARDTLLANHLLNRTVEDLDAGQEVADEAAMPPFDVYTRAVSAAAVPDEPGLVHWTATVARPGAGAVFQRDWYRVAP